MLLKAGLVLVAQRRAVDTTCSHIAHHLHHQQLSMLFTDLSLSHELELLLVNDSLITHLLSLLTILLLFIILIIVLLKVSIAPWHLYDLLFLVGIALGFLLFIFITSYLGLRLLRGNNRCCCIGFCSLLLGSSCRLKGEIVRPRFSSSLLWDWLRWI